MVWSLAFDPLVPLWALVAGGVIAVLLTAFSGFLNLRGWLLRTLTMALLLLALANPAVEREDREPLFKRRCSCRRQEPEPTPFRSPVDNR